MGQVLYAQLGMIRGKDSDNKTEMENTNKYNFPGKSARSIRWFNRDH